MRKTALTSGRSQAAEPERVSGIPFGTGADGDVVADGADGADSASTGTRVLALVPRTSPVHGTVRAGQALRTAALVRISEVLRLTLTHRIAVFGSATSVRTARGRVAWIRWRWGSRRWSWKRKSTIESGRNSFQS